MKDISDKDRKEVEKIRQNITKDFKQDEAEIKERINEITEAFEKDLEQAAEQAKERQRKSKRIEGDTTHSRNELLVHSSEEAFLQSEVLLVAASLGLTGEKELNRFEQELVELEKFAEGTKDEASVKALSRAQKNVQLAIQVAKNN